MSQKKIKIAEIGPYPPPGTGWSVRIKKLKEAFLEQGHDCVVLNTGQSRNVKSVEFISVFNAFDYLKKLFWLKWKGYAFHIHTNAQAIKGPCIHLVTQLLSLFFGTRSAITFHGGYEQLYFPKRKAGKMYFIIYLNFLLAKCIICNDNNIKKSIYCYGPGIKNGKIFPVQAFSLQYIPKSNAVIPNSIIDYINSKKYVLISYLSIRYGYHIENLIYFIENKNEDIGLVLVGIESVEDKELNNLYTKLDELASQGKVLLAGSLPQEQFFTMLKKSDIYLRTYIYDGVSSSVLEALATGTIVVACENGQRPNGVVTFAADDVHDMMEKIYSVLRNKEVYANQIIFPKIQDTVTDEIKILRKSL